MKKHRNSEELFEYSCNCFRYLRDIGFEKTISQDKAIFTSQIFKIIILKDRYGEPPTIVFRSAQKNEELVSPYTALQYFLDDYLDEWRQIENKLSDTNQNLSEKGIFVEAELLKKYSYFLLDDEWTRDQGLLNAVRKNQEWFIEQLAEGKKIPSHQETVRRLHSLKPMPSAT